MGVDSSLETFLTTRPDVTWSVSIRDVATDAHWSYQPHLTCSVASVGKLLLLATALSRIDSRSLTEQELLHRTSAVNVADSGLWQHLDVDTLSIHDAMVLIASVSDNLATNALLDRVSLSAVADSLPNRDFRLHDYVRDVRSTEHPRTLATGTAAAVESFWTDIARESLISPTVSKRLQDLLRLNTDLSMVASAVQLDPLSHHDGSDLIRIANKTGSDIDVRADSGLIEWPGRSRIVAYAAIANWDRDLNADLGAINADMRRIGEFVATRSDSR